MPNNVVPSFPPLHTIKDPAVQSALLALKNGWEARNGLDKNIRFITEAEVAAMIKKVSTVAPDVQTIVQDFSRPAPMSSESTGSGADLLPLNNIWTGQNIWNVATPVDESAPNCHFTLARDDAAWWTFALGHAIIPPGATGSTIGNLYINDPGRGDPATPGTNVGGVRAILYPEFRGGGADWFGRFRVFGKVDASTFELDSPNPTSVLTENAHIRLLRNGVKKWHFALGHTLEGNGNMYLVDSTAGISITLKSMANGGALSFLERATAHKTNRTAIALSDSMSIAWDSSGSIKSLFDAAIGRFCIRNGSNEILGVNANTESDWGLFRNSAPIKASGISLVQQVGLSGAANTAPAGPNGEKSIQYYWNELADTVYDAGVSINHIRNMTDKEGSPPSALNAYLATLGSTAGLADTVYDHGLRINATDDLLAQQVTETANAYQLAIALANISGSYTLSTTIASILQRLDDGGL